ncbi:hypothetical protein B0H12DRAFT_1074911 [Mycena haematopus]|nr:hypothetical protein B0H12DRAFT_1074911 [Mycena haematopus]
MVEATAPDIRSEAEFPPLPLGPQDMPERFASPSPKAVPPESSSSSSDNGSASKEDSEANQASSSQIATPSAAAPTEPRSMRKKGLAYRDLAARLSSPPPTSSAPARSRPIIQDFGPAARVEAIRSATPLTLASRISRAPRARTSSPPRPPLKRSKVEEKSVPEEQPAPTPAPTGRKMRRGKRSGKANWEQEQLWAEKRAEWKAKAEAEVMATATAEAPVASTSQLQSGATDDALSREDAPFALPEAVRSEESTSLLFADNDEGWHDEDNLGSAMNAAAGPSRPEELAAVTAITSEAWLAGEDVLDYGMDDGEFEGDADMFDATEE